MEVTNNDGPCGVVAQAPRRGRRATCCERWCGCSPSASWPPRSTRVCNAGYGEVTAERVNSRNGFRHRDFDTRVGTIDLAIPKLRTAATTPGGCSSPQAPGRAGAHPGGLRVLRRGVSTRRVEGLVQALGIEHLSKSQVSSWPRTSTKRSRPSGPGPWTPAPTPTSGSTRCSRRCREAGRIQSVAVVIATGVNADGHREVLGMDVITDRGRGGVARLPARAGRPRALGRRARRLRRPPGPRRRDRGALPGATWQRCRTHFMRNLLTKVPKSAQGFVATLVRTIFAQPDAEPGPRPARPGRRAARGSFPDAAAMLDDAATGRARVHALPEGALAPVWSNNPQERLNREMRRRTDVVGIFPNRAAVVRLVGAVLAEQHDEWAVARRYMAVEHLVTGAHASHRRRTRGGDPGSARRGGLRIHDEIEVVVVVTPLLGRDRAGSDGSTSLGLSPTAPRSGHGPAHSLVAMDPSDIVWRRPAPTRSS